MLLGMDNALKLSEELNLENKVKIIKATALACMEVLNAIANGAVIILDNIKIVMFLLQ